MTKQFTPPQRSLHPERLELFEMSLPLLHPFTTSFGTLRDRRLVLLKLTDKDGCVGWGEITTLDAPLYNADFLDAAVVAVEQILWPVLTQKAPFAGPLAFDHALDFVRGNQAAKAALSMAAYDLAAQKAGLSLATFIGATLPSFQVSRTLSVPKHLPPLVHEAEQIAAEGYRALKLKIAPGADLSACLALRRALPQSDLMVDANAAYTPSADSMRLFYALDALDLFGIEQPFSGDDFVDHARLQAALRTPIMLDESISGEAAFHQATTLNSGRILNIKYQRIGSLSATLRLIASAQKRGWGLFTGSLLEGPLGFAVIMALASHPAMSLPADFIDGAFWLDGFSTYWKQKPFTVSDGILTPHHASLGFSDSIDLSGLTPQQKGSKVLKAAA